MRVKFVVGSLPCSEKFFSGTPIFSSPLLKIDTSKFQFDQESAEEPLSRCATSESLFIIHLFIWIPEDLLSRPVPLSPLVPKKQTIIKIRIWNCVYSNYVAHDTKEHCEGFEPSFRTKGERHQFVGLEIPAGKWVLNVRLKRVLTGQIIE